jgi:hypothetical protein
MFVPSLSSEVTTAYDPSHSLVPVSVPSTCVGLVLSVVVPHIFLSSRSLIDLNRFYQYRLFLSGLYEYNVAISRSSYNALCLPV